MTNDKPIIKTFVHNSRYYLYDAFSNCLFEINKGQYYEIQLLKKIGINKFVALNKNDKQYQDIVMLINRGLLKKTFISEIEHPAVKNINALLDRGVNEIILQITKDCNFKCRYCLFANDTNTNRTHEKINMSFETAKSCVDFLYEHSADASVVNISFYGGEPLLNFETIKKVVEYANNKFSSKKIVYSMTINGSLLTDGILEFIVKNDFNIAISLDGPKNIQNKHRKFLGSGKGTFDVVYKCINKIKKEYNNYFQNNVSFLPVVIDDEKYDNVLKFFLEAGIQEEMISPSKANFSGVDYTYADLGGNNSNIKSLSKESDDINKSNIEKLNALYENKGTISTKWHHKGQCIPGVNRLFIDVDGEFYPCEKVVEDDTLSIGNIKTGFDLDKIINLMSIGKLTEDECKSCWAVHFCEICAMMCADIESHTISRERKLSICEAQKSTALWFFKRHINDASDKLKHNLE